MLRCLLYFSGQGCPIVTNFAPGPNGRPAYVVRMDARDVGLTFWFEHVDSLADGRQVYREVSEHDAAEILGE